VTDAGRPGDLVIFDLNGTLTDARALARPWGEAAPARLGPEALDEAVMMSMADTLSGVFRPFPDLLRGALGRRARLAGLPAGDELDAAIELAAALPAHPDAAAALDHLRADGRRIAVLTNSAADAARRTLEAAGLADRIDALHGADAAQAYKPDPAVYALVGVEPGAWFVAAHWWDVTGAARAGLRTAWVSRDDRVLPSTAPEPEVCAPDLVAAARAITAAG
jgi:2-haloacid dehalogenase